MLDDVTDGSRKARVALKIMKKAYDKARTMRQGSFYTTPNGKDGLKYNHFREEQAVPISEYISEDDILDVVGSTEALGKPVGSDAENNKTTYVTVRGMENAQKDVEMLTSAAVSRLSAFENTDFLKTLALYLVNRNK